MIQGERLTESGPIPLQVQPPSPLMLGCAAGLSAPASALHKTPAHGASTVTLTSPQEPTLLQTSPQAVMHLAPPPHLFAACVRRREGVLLGRPCWAAGVIAVTADCCHLLVPCEEMGPLPWAGQHGRPTGEFHFPEAKLTQEARFSGFQDPRGSDF